MASFVQEIVKNTGGSFGVTASSSSLGIDGGAKTVTVGNVIVVYCATDIINVNTCADNLGNGYELVFSQDYALHNIRLSLFVAQVTFGGSLTAMTVTHTTTADRMFMVAEFSGAGIVLDTGFNTGTSSTPNTLAVADGEIHLWAAAVYDVGDTAGNSLTAPTGFTDTSSRSWGTPLRKLYNAHKIGTATGTLTGTIGASKDWVTMSGALDPIPVRPALAGISFDGVTVR